MSAPTASRRLALFSSDAHGHAHAAAEAKHNDAHHAGASAHGDHHHDHHHDHHGHHEEHHHEEHHHAPEFVKDPNVLYLSREEVARHSTENDCWIIVRGKVYDVSNYLPFHPGRKAILTNAGHDSTALFEGACALARSLLVCARSRSMSVC